MLSDDGGSAKSVPTSGKITLADMIGGDKILAAMKTNEDDTVAAYERASSQCSISPELKTLCERAHADELRHRSWVERSAEGSRTPAQDEAAALSAIGYRGRANGARHGARSPGEGRSCPLLRQLARSTR